MSPLTRGFNYRSACYDRPMFYQKHVKFAFKIYLSCSFDVIMTLFAGRWHLV